MDRFLEASMHLHQMDQSCQVQKVHTKTSEQSSPSFEEIPATTIAYVHSLSFFVHTSTSCSDEIFCQPRDASMRNFIFYQLFLLNTAPFVSDSQKNFRI